MDETGTTPSAAPGAAAAATLETRNIVILGASFAGLSAAHYLARHALPQLQSVKGVKYELHLVDPSTKFWWHIAAPREMVSVKDMKHEDYFFPVMDGFAQYTSLKDAIFFHHATATAIDTQARTVALKTHDGADELIGYYALILATGVRSPTPLTTLQGDYTISQKALEASNTALASAKDIIIAGGGPVGVETAGEIGSRYGKTAKVTLLSGSDKLLPILRPSLATKAQKQLEKFGVTVTYNARVQSSKVDADGKTSVVLANGTTMTADVYIPAFGVTPNTDFLPAELKATNGYVQANKETLRVDAAGVRVYAVGDVAGVDQGGVLKLHESLPVAGANIAYDLMTDANLKSKVGQRKYVRKDKEMQVVPVGAKTGVGAFNGMILPGFIVGFVKGKDYLKSQIQDITHGKKWAKA